MKRVTRPISGLESASSLHLSTFVLVLPVERVKERQTNVERWGGETPSRPFFFNVSFLTQMRKINDFFTAISKVNHGFSLQT